VLATVGDEHTHEHDNRPRELLARFRPEDRWNVDEPALSRLSSEDERGRRKAATLDTFFGL